MLYCEEIFLRGVLEFILRNGYVNEVKFIEIVWNWYKDVDGRGFFEEIWL